MTAVALIATALAFTGWTATIIVLFISQLLLSALLLLGTLFWIFTRDEDGD
jgi:hypothetical protein